MKLSLIYEAGMNRRSFLKLMGKAAGAAIAPSDTVLKSVSDLVSGGAPVIIKAWFGSSTDGGFNADDEFNKVTTLLKTFKKLGAKNLSIQGQSLQGNIDPQLLQQLIPKLEKVEDHKALYRLDLGNTAINFISPKDDWYSTVLKYADSKNIVDNIDGVYRAVLSNLNKFAERGWNVTYSNSLKNWISGKGWEITPTKIISFEDVPDHIKQVIRNRLKHDKDYYQQLKQRSPEMLPPEYRENTHSPREFGHERVGFDPKSSRPAQAVGPFESRLVDKLGTLI